MDRPYIFCHMLTSLDGKIMGNYMDAPESGPAGEVFYEIAFGKERAYQHQGWLSGRVTTDEILHFIGSPIWKKMRHLYQMVTLQQNVPICIMFRLILQGSWAGRAIP